MNCIHRISLALVLPFIFAATVHCEDPELEKSLAEINDRFQNMDVKLVQWPDELQTRLGELKTIAFMAHPVKKTDVKLPLLIALHGAGGKDKSVQFQLARSAEVKGLSLAETAGRNLVLLEPNSAGDFDPKTLNTMLDYVLETHVEIDPNRVYVMGHSMGGSGTWKWILQSPERFAAAAPCGFSSGDTGDVSRLLKLPIWGMVGGDDGKNTPSVKKMVRRLQDAGNANAKFKAFPNANHSRGNKAVFSSVELIDWMLGHSRERKATP
jgi:predicted peptidase